MTEPQTLDLDACIAGAALTISRRFYGYVQAEDLRQEGHLWALEHPETIQAYEEHEEPKLAAWLLTRDLRVEMELYARRERAAFLGYNVEDEQFYSKSLIEAALPAALSGDLSSPAQGLELGRKPGGPTSEGGDWQVIVMDVQIALSAAGLTDEERACLSHHYRDGEAQADIARLLNTDQSSVSRALARGVRKVIDSLGGGRPRECWEAGCLDHPAA